jgi:hypothetical protein
MNIYDPADRIQYIHMAGKVDAVNSSRVEDSPTCTRLPSGYANQSPPTRLQRRPPRIAGDPVRAALFSAQVPDLPSGCG